MAELLPDQVFTVTLLARDRDDDDWLMGVFLTIEDAKAAVEARVRSLPGGGHSYEWSTFPNLHCTEYSDAGGGRTHVYSIEPCPFGRLQ